MAKVVQEGFDEYDKMLRSMTARRRHEFVAANPVEYAEYLQDRHGYWVFSNDHLVRFANVQVRRITDRGVPLTTQSVENMLEAVGFTYLNFLRSVTGQMRPPVRAGEGPRSAHPGGWADITGNLNRGYYFIVNGRPFDRRFNFTG